MRTQVTFDTTDPHAQADFWAAVLRLEVEDHGEFVDGLVASGRMPEQARVVRHGRSTFADVAAVRDPDGQEPRLYFQKVPEGKTAKNRVHLDLQVDGDMAAEVARMIGLGARELSVTSDRGPETHTMADPEGNEFCLH